jgi:hypothetical protein
MLQLIFFNSLIFRPKLFSFFKNQRGFKVEGYGYIIRTNTLLILANLGIQANYITKLWKLICCAMISDVIKGRLHGNLCMSYYCRFEIALLHVKS